MVIKSIVIKLRDQYRNVLRRHFMKKKIEKLKNAEICLISSKCNGACILHDLGLEFKSPFVNLWIKPSDYIKMLKSLKYYMECDLLETEEEGITYPVGILDDIKIYFQHYFSFEEAKRKWEERKARMDYNNLYVLFADTDRCTEKDIMEFDNLPYKNKAVFVNKPRVDIKSAVYIRGFENEDGVGICVYYKGKLSYKKYYDDFDYVAWFNQGK